MKSRDYKKEIDKFIQMSDEHDAVLVVNFHNDKFNPYDFPGYKEAEPVLSDLTNSAYLCRATLTVGLDLHSFFHKLLG